MFGRKKIKELEEEVQKQHRQMQVLKQDKERLEAEVTRLRNDVEDAYKSYPKIEFLTRIYTSLLADIKKQMDGVILATKYASEKIIRSDIGMLDTEAVFARALSKVMKMSPPEIQSELQDSVMEDSQTGTLTFYDAEEFDSSRDYGFRNNKMIRDVVLPEGIKTIKRGFFYGCSNLRRLHIPYTVERIEDYAFFGCAALSQLEFESNSRLTEIGDYAFSSCNSLTEVTLPKSLKGIDAAAFRECLALQKVVWQGENVEKLGNHAFQGCRELTEFTIPPEVATLQTSLFNGCARLEKIVVPWGVGLVMDYAFKGCAGLKEIQFESGYTEISKYTLEGIPDETAITVEGRRLAKRPEPEHTVMLKDVIVLEES